MAVSLASAPFAITCDLPYEAVAAVMDRYVLMSITGFQ